MQYRYKQDDRDLFDQFFRDGYLILPDFVTSDDCDCLMMRMDELVDAFVRTDQVTSVFSTLTHDHMKDKYFLESADNIYYFFEKDAFGEGGLLYPIQDSLNKVSHALHDKDLVFNDFCYQPRIKVLMQDLGYSDPVIRQSMYIFKQARIGGEVAMHQDSTFLHTNGKPVIGVWVALEDATLDNGCLWVIPGGHTEPLRQKFVRHRDDTLSFATLDITPYNQDGAIPLEVKKGTAVVLHGLLPHSSKQNTSGQSRHAFTMHLTDRQDGFPVGNWMRGYDDNA
ncbi:MAG: phytanoyl-CoA dioxygenase family protein [Candidatus Paracaedibacteraceae bacterium]|nr:phytanoyl-CoA dioxygenase family protein [Candidatus Paracaedibacteraceae bacterium]